MSATLKSWLQGRPSLESLPSTPNKDNRPFEASHIGLGRTHSFNDFSCSAADDAERNCGGNDRFRTRAVTPADTRENTAEPAADWLQFRRAPVARASCGAAISSPVRITPRSSMASTTGGSSEDGAPETPTAGSLAKQHKSESIEHWEWSELMHGSSV